MTFTHTNTEEPHILDSGERREFESGAVRDIQEGKGRCDLMPLEIVADLLGDRTEKNDSYDKVLYGISLFCKYGSYDYLYNALAYFGNEYFADLADMCLKVAVHFEEGAKKYGENNWQKGIPVRCYIDSAVRHYLKYLRGDIDEYHDRACAWNLMCAIWTCRNMPRLNDYAPINKPN